MSFNRRDLFQFGLAGMGAALSSRSLAATVGRALGVTSSAVTGAKKLLVIDLKGGCDGASLAIPFGDSTYAAERGTAAWAPSEMLPIPGASYARIPQELGAVLSIAQNGHLAFVAQSGLVDGTRSHFNDSDTFAKAASASSEGFVPKAMLAANIPNLTSAMFPTAMSLTNLQHAAFRSAQAASLTAHVRSLDTYNLDGLVTGSILDATLPTSTADHLSSTNGLDALVATNTDFLFDTKAAIQSLGTQYHSAIDFPLDAAELAIAASQGGPGPVPEFDPRGAAFFKSLEQAVVAMEAANGVDMSIVEFGGFDTHGKHKTEMQKLLRYLGWGLRSAYERFGQLAAETLILVVTEFGRTEAVNGSDGLDHGNGTCFLAVGPGVRGGTYNIHGTTIAIGAQEFGALWRPMGTTSSNPLYTNATDVVTDFRHVLAEVFTKALGVPSGNLDQVIDGYSSLSTAGYLPFLL